MSDVLVIEVRDSHENPRCSILWEWGEHEATYRALKLSYAIGSLNDDSTTEEIIENGKVSGITATDVQKILNLKHAWEFILDRDVVASRSDYYMLSHIARLVNEGFFAEGGRIRGVPVTIGGLSYVPPLPNELDVKDRVREIVEENDEPINIAI